MTLRRNPILIFFISKEAKKNTFSMILDMIFCGGTHRQVQKNLFLPSLLSFTCKSPDIIMIYLFEEREITLILQQNVVRWYGKENSISAEHLPDEISSKNFRITLLHKNELK